ncbi:DeoR/GlpR transcriptional regulator [Panacibacter sp. DH6]|uniref:DeoR/GlpR transcriptional regulator n=1 Tax=Panacibacter microcysteis TaxID=2793269 RepID=A0A931GT46_9BACT|nr:DeoR/GlpR family DNA-binding transcription regulator [Panacibacter microcysteis]MBG9375146.1 DeoR/GlpR transcriptional regulator [Panacibacter microcysteis]
MNFEERKREILKLTEAHSSVSVAMLAKNLHTSAITIRRDLAVLAGNGLLYRTHGGAMKVNEAVATAGYIDKSIINAQAKDVICKKAATFIKDGDIIFMDCGSTVSRLCAYIKYRKIRVVTNSLPVVYELMNSSVQLTVTGGQVDKERRAIHGVMALEQIARYKCDKAFIGVDGISLAKGLSAKTEKEAGVTKAIASGAGEVFLLCDSGKLEKDQYFQFGSLNMINYLVTDGNADKKLLQRYTKRGIHVIV